MSSSTGRLLEYLLTRTIEQMIWLGACAIESSFSVTSGFKTDRPRPGIETDPLSYRPLVKK
jgi:hypothetical protein